MKNNTSLTIVSISMFSIAILLLNPFDFWMPDMVMMSMLAFLFVLFALFASFVLQEGAEDERESVHRTLAGRNAFLAGSGILVLGLSVQSYNHAVDFWLVIALIVMIATKLLTRWWSDRNL